MTTEQTFTVTHPCGHETELVGTRAEWGESTVRAEAGAPCLACRSRDKALEALERGDGETAQRALILFVQLAVTDPQDKWTQPLVRALSVLRDPAV